MNIIRTATVELSEIPAIAYKQKLAAGGAGLKIHRLDRDAVGVYTIDRRGGVPSPYGPVDSKLFPEEALLEAVELTLGMPYSKRGKIKVSAHEDAPKDAEDVTEEDVEACDMVGSPEYEAIVERYSDEKGKMNYHLMNRDFMAFANKSKVVSDMVAARATEDEILRFIVKSRATILSGKKESPTDRETDCLIETLDEIDPRGAFKELKAFIRRQLARP